MKINGEGGELWEGHVNLPMHPPASEEWVTLREFGYINLYITYFHNSLFKSIYNLSIKTESSLDLSVFWHCRESLKRSSYKANHYKKKHTFVRKFSSLKRVRERENHKTLSYLFSLFFLCWVSFFVCFLGKWCVMKTNQTWTGSFAAQHQSSLRFPSQRFHAFTFNVIFFLN